MYLKGWNGAAQYLSVTSRTLKRWHYDYIKIPWQRDARYAQSRLRIHMAILDLWYEQIVKLRTELKRGQE